MIRGTCALAGLLALLLQGSSGGHMLLVEHTRCAEHGELIHGGETHHHGDASRVEADDPVFQGVSDEASEEAHEHCAVTVDRRDALLGPIAAQGSAGFAERYWPAAFTDGLLPVETRRFRVAPKNSPPA